MRAKTPKQPARQRIVFPCTPSSVALVLRRFAADGWKVESITPVSFNQTDIVFYK